MTYLIRITLYALIITLQVVFLVGYEVGQEFTKDLAYGVERPSTNWQCYTVENNGSFEYEHCDLVVSQ